MYHVSSKSRSEAFCWWIGEAQWPSAFNTGRSKLDDFGKTSVLHWNRKKIETAWLFDFLLKKLLLPCLQRNTQEPDVCVRCLDELEDLDTYQHGSTHVMPLMNLHLATSAVHVWHSGKRGQDWPGSRHCNAACARAKPQKIIEHICIIYPLAPRIGWKTVSICPDVWWFSIVALYFS